MTRYSNKLPKLIYSVGVEEDFNTIPIADATTPLVVDEMAELALARLSVRTGTVAALTTHKE